MKISQICWINFQNNQKRYLRNINAFSDSRVSATEWSQIISNKNNTVFFVTTTRGRVIGYGVYTEIKTPSLHCALTDYDARDEDVFDLLIQTLREKAESQGMKIKSAT
jgi:hypothetical protein